jgi:hypothetical protein
VKCGHLFGFETDKGGRVFDSSVSGFFEFMGGESACNLQWVCFGCAVFESFGVGAKDNVRAIFDF